MSEEKEFYVGNLFAPRWASKTSNFRWDDISDVVKGESEAPGWCSYRLISDNGLLKKQETSFEGDKFVYHFLVRQSGIRFLLACSAKEVLAHLLKIAGMENRVTSPTINVSAMVAAITEQPNDYVLGKVNAHIDGYGQAFRTMIMYGSDLGDSKLFRDVLPSIAPYRATLKSQLHHEDVLTVSSIGEVSFMHRNSRSLHQVDNALRFLAQNKFMDWNLE